MTVTSRSGAATRRPSTTVVVLNWNGSAMLPACLDSVAALDYPKDRLQVIVVDNGSTDGSLSLIRSRYPHVQLIAHDENRGFAAANNGAAREATGDYVAFLNNDARVDRQWLNELVNHLEAFPSVALAGSLVLNWDGSRVDFGGSAMSLLGHGHQLGYGAPADEAPREPSAQLFVNGAAMLTRRELFLEAGGFDEHYFAYFEDVDLGWRLWVLGWEVALVPSSVAYHRHHGTSRHVPERKMALLFARNSLLTIAKNYESALFSRLVPIALLAVGEQIESRLGIDPRDLRISGADASSRRPASTPPSQSSRRRARQVLTIARSWRRIVAVLRGLRAPRTNPGAAALAAAMSDVLAAWPQVMEARETIQAVRRRSDESILPLFRLAEIPPAPAGSDALAVNALAWAANSGEADRTVTGS